MPQRFDFLVLGGGVAGLSFALEASGQGSVAVLTKRSRSEGNTVYAQGGVAAVLSEQDSFRLHQRTPSTPVELNHPTRCDGQEGPGGCELAALGAFPMPARRPARPHPGGQPHTPGASSTRGHHHAGRWAGAPRRRRRSAQHQFVAARSHRPHPGTEESPAAPRCLSARAARQRADRDLPGNSDGAGHRSAGRSASTPPTPTWRRATGWRGLPGGGAHRQHEFYQFHPTASSARRRRTTSSRGAPRRAAAPQRRASWAVITGRLAPRDSPGPSTRAKAQRRRTTCSWTRRIGPPFLIERFPNICGVQGLRHRQRCSHPGSAARTSAAAAPPTSRTEQRPRVVRWAGRPTGLHRGNRLASNSLLEGWCSGTGRRAAAENPLPRRRPTTFPAWDLGSAVDPNEAVLVTQNWEEVRRLMWNYVESSTPTNG